MLFGLIMVLTFTGTISVADAGRTDIRAMLVGALGCNLAWGVIDAVLYLMGSLASKSRPRTLTATDWQGALAVFLLVFLSTVPISLPFLLFPGAAFAMRASNAVAIAMLFGMGWTLGKHTGRSGWRAGLAMVCLGLVLVAITIALGG